MIRDGTVVRKEVRHPGVIRSYGGDSLSAPTKGAHPDVMFSAESQGMMTASQSRRVRSPWMTKSCPATT